MKGLSFSLKRVVGISGLKTKVARKTSIPTTKTGLGTQNRARCPVDIYRQ